VVAQLTNAAGRLVGNMPFEVALALGHEAAEPLGDVDELARGRLGRFHLSASLRPSQGDRHFAT
jgi:hypothetical protein